MKLIYTLFFILVSFQVKANHVTPSPEEETLAQKGYAVLCAQTLGVMNADHLDNDLNKRIRDIKTKVTVSAPTLTVSLLNIVDQKSTDPGALAILCVTLTKKN